MKDIENLRSYAYGIEWECQQRASIEALTIGNKSMVGHCGLEPQTSVLSGLTPLIRPANQLPLGRQWQCRLLSLASDAIAFVVPISPRRELGSARSTTTPIPFDKDWNNKLERLAGKQRTNLIEDIRVFFASKDMGFGEAGWPLQKVAVQHALPLNQDLSEHAIDLKAKEVINAVIGVRGLVRKAIALLEPDREDSQIWVI